MSLTLTLERGGGEVSGSGTNIELDGTIAGGAIESVEMYGDTEQQTYSGKNLLNLVPVSSTSNGITTTLNADGSLTCSGTASDTWANVTTTTVLPQTLSASDVIVFSIQASIPAQLYARTLVSSPYQRKDYIINVGNTSSGSSAIGMAADSVYLFLNNLTVGVTYNFTIKQVQLEKSSTPTTFEPYVGGTASPNPDYPQEVQTVTGRQVVTISDGGSESQEYEINLGKNLFDIDQYTNAVTRGSTLVSLTKTSDTTLRTTNLYASTNNYCAIPIPDASRLLGHTITMSFSVSLTNVTAAKAAIFWKTTTNTVGTQIGDTLSITTGGAKTLTFSVPDTFPSGTNGIFCTIYGSDTAQPVDSYVDWSNIQLERGSTATTYAPYFTPIELCKIGTYQDYIYKSGEDWYVHKETGKVTFTGAETETWSSATAATGYVRFSIASGATHADNNGYCNELINRGSQSHGAYEYVWVQPNANAFYIQLLNTRVSDLASFRTWLGANPVTVYYDIATPTDTQITNSALIAQLDALNEATTYDGTTVITVSSENLAGSLEVTVSTNIAKTYTEVEIGSPFTITDVEGKSSNTTLDGNVYVDWAYNKKQYSFDLFNLTPQDYADIRAFYDYQFNNSAFPTITVPELNIDKLPVYMEISSRNIINQCLLTDKLTIKFRETVQP